MATPKQLAAFAASRAAAKEAMRLATQERLLDLLTSDRGATLTPKQLAYELGFSPNYLRRLLRRLEADLTLPTEES